MTLKRLPSRPLRVHYQYTWDQSGTGSWTQGANASSIARNTTADAGAPGVATACLAWTATAAGDSRVQSPQVSVPASTEVLFVARLALGGSGTFNARLHADWYASGGGYIAGEYGFTRTGLVAGTGDFYHLPCPVKLPANAVTAQVAVTVFSASAAQALYIDNVLILR